MSAFHPEQCQGGSSSLYHYWMPFSARAVWASSDSTMPEAIPASATYVITDLCAYCGAIRERPRGTHA